MHSLWSLFSAMQHFQPPGTSLESLVWLLLLLWVSTKNYILHDYPSHTIHESSLSSFHICTETQTHITTLERRHLLDIYYTELTKHLAWVPMIIFQLGSIFIYIVEKWKLSEMFFPIGKEEKQILNAHSTVLESELFSHMLALKSHALSTADPIMTQKLSSWWKMFPHDSGQAKEWKLNREDILLGYPYIPVGLWKW